MRIKAFFTAVAMLTGAWLSGAQLDPNGFITEWLICGPFPSVQINSTGQGFKTDFLTEWGGESGVRPYEGLSTKSTFPVDISKLIAGIGSTNEWGFSEEKAFDAEWKKHVVPPSGYKTHEFSHQPFVVVNLDEMFGLIKDYMVSYSAAYILSPEDRQIKVRLGADDDFKVYLNGKLLGEKYISQGTTPDNYIYDAELKRGLNLLLMKVVDRVNGCDFCLALSDRDDKPLTGVEILTDNPAREIQLKSGLAAEPQCYDNGFAVDFVLPEEINFAGRTVVDARVYGDKSYDTARFSLRSADREIASKEFKKGEPLQLSAELAAGKYSATLALDNAAVLSGEFEIFDSAQVAKEHEELPAELKLFEDKRVAAENELQELQSVATELHQRHAELYGELEEAYAARRAEIAKNAGESARSISEKITPAPDAERLAIRLNGDNWQIAPGFSRDRKNNGYTPPPEEVKRTRINLPRTHFNEYFRPWFYPVTSVKPNDPHGAVKGLPGWDDFTFDSTLCLEKFWVSTEVDLGQNIEGKEFSFVCEGVLGAIKLFNNGERCGDYSGVIGTVEIPLKNVKPGKNLIEIFFSSPQESFLKGGFHEKFAERYGGIRGNLYVKRCASQARSEGMEIKTSWRDNQISVKNELVNPTDKPLAVTVKNYAVLDGDIRYKLPEVSGTIPADGTLELTSRGLWSDPELWGIGGKYGDPTLYTMVSDLYVDGKLVDRNCDEFGFREFWVEGCDFFLNGKHIMLLGDVGLDYIDIPKRNDILFNLDRSECNVNIIRNHDGEWASQDFLRSCDRLGMLVYANMYPILHDDENVRKKDKTFIPQDEWFETDFHKDNLKHYANWVKMLRNHPAVVILSTDNEVFTQAWDMPASRDFNERNDKLAAFYSQYVKSLDPDRVITRDGDVGTWNWEDKQSDSPVCDTANYHYPDFNINELVINWQKVFGYRPAIWGETLYHSYGAWDNWRGAIPEAVTQKAARVRQCAQIYKDWFVPGQIFMGPISDGFILFDESGKGNPWGIRASEHERYKDKKEQLKRFPKYPWTRISYPSLSGPGRAMEFARNEVKIVGKECINWYDPAVATHVNNEVNAAYKQTLPPQPPLNPDFEAECVIDLGRANAGKIVYARKVDAPLQKFAVRADGEGTAWFVLPDAGEYRFSTADMKPFEVDVPSRKDYAFKPGFDQILKVKKY